MSIKPEIEGSGSPLDTLLLALAAGVLVSGIAGYYFLPDQPQFVTTVGGFMEPARWLVVLLAAAVAVLITYQTQLGKSSWNFLQGSRVELRKVVWPTRQETLQTTIFVIVFVIILGLFLWGLDALLLWGTKYLTRGS